MTPAEVVISVVGLIAGYWLVSNFITGSKSASGRDDGAKVEDIERVTLANWYQILEVAEAANREEISSAYKRKISQYHPTRSRKSDRDSRGRGRQVATDQRRL